MTQTFAELLLLIPAALGTGFLIFIAGTLQGVMNDMDEATFHRFLMMLDKHALKSPYAIAASTLTFVGMIPYWYFYGFANWCFTAGLILFTIASIISKKFNLPIYKRIFALKSSDTTQLREERHKLEKANLLRATIQFISLVLMVIGFA